ncbi:MAG TPA: hypothetical protein PKZ07_14415 [Sedimentisphaerales bacterium]|nr:hypothetical protein [Sedimentisphaerales bacterium]
MIDRPKTRSTQNLFLRAMAACWLSVLTHPPSTSHAARIRLDPDMLINLSGQRPAVELVDEQDLAGDPRTGDASPAKTSYSNGWINARLHYPLSIVIDLGSTHDLTDVCFFDMEGNSRLTVDARRSDAWDPLFVDELKEYRRWSSHKAVVSTRHLRLTFESPSALIGEILLYGTAREPRPPLPQARPHTQALMESFIGINGFVDDPIERIAACGHLREYHSWQWDEGNQDPTYPGYPHHQLAWSPSWVSGPGWGWDFDAFYRQLKDVGVEVAPCLQGCAPYLVGFDKERTDEKPVAGQDPAEPRSYIAHASYLFQFAARYGGTPCDATLLKLKPGQPVKSGLNLVRYIENWNEPDKWWKDRASHFQPFELAAMCSADYDGHKGSLGPGVGVKNADPNMKLVLGGLARPEIEYLKAMKLWAEFHREGDFPADVINLHHYSNDTGGQGGNPTTGISPEADGLRERFERVVRWRDRFLPGKEVWVSEFGYDTNPKSNQRAPAIGQASAEEVQGQWIVRSYLALAASGVDRAQLYMLRDVDAASTTQYDSSGLTASKGNRHQPKRSWFYVATLRHVLRGTRFESEVPSGDANVRIYRFRSEAPPSREVYAVWCPTSNATEVRDFSLELPNAITAAMTTLDPQNPTGKSTPLTIADGKVTLTVSESPAFVVTSVTSREPQAR